MRSSFAVLALSFLALAGSVASGPVAAVSTEPKASEPAPPQMPPDMAEAFARAEANYAQYCALCHADDRTGYANDSAPSLVSPSLYAAAPLPIGLAIAYGRPGTPMGPYLDEMGGPMTMTEIREMTQWLLVKSGSQFVPPDASMLQPVAGDISLGETLYAANCAVCHGAKGEGGSGKVHGTALGNATMLATTPDSFLKTAIVRGREGTTMPGWQGTLEESEIDAIVAFLRSRASGWDAEAAKQATIPKPDEFVLNPAGAPPEFALEDDRYIRSEQLASALEQGRKMVLLDTRVPYFWAMAHIEGSVPVPYYSSLESLAEQLPNDGTWIVAYCECPRAAADHTVDKLRQLGFKNTAVLWEGYVGWSAKGNQVVSGKVE